VAIVGAGMAGLAAAHALKWHGIPFVLLEARDRIGGRAYTDWNLLNVPVDHGCAFLHASAGNPLTPKVTEMGYTILHRSGPPEVYFGGNDQGAKGQRALQGAYDQLVRAIGVTGEHGDDVAAGDLLNSPAVWDRLAAWAVGPAEAGIELAQLSTLDWYTHIGPGLGRDGLVREGLGSVVTAFGAGIPVSLSTRVKTIDWNGPGIRLETQSGTVEADCCLITVPVGVLRDGAISMMPALPTAKQSAIAGITMGVVNKIALAFRPGTLPPARNTWLYQVRKDGTIADVLVRPAGYDMTVQFTGGNLAREMELLNDADQIAFALAAVSDIFGNATATGFSGGVVTRWGRDPYSLGSHSAALPGQAHQRAELAKPVADKLYFAGEACAAAWASTLPGAYISGRTAAHAIAERHG
jgi:monoamine oxidase